MCNLRGQASVGIQTKSQIMLTFWFRLAWKRVQFEDVGVQPADHVVDHVLAVGTVKASD